MPRLLLILLLLLLPPVLRAAGPPPLVATVYVFLADTCPISQNATPTLRALHTAYAPRGVRFVGVFPAPQMRPADVVLFQKQYTLPFPLRLDAGQQLTHRLGARITPEVVVLAPDDATVLYQGRIDDAYARLGQRRTVVQHHELRDALAAIVARQPVPVPRTEAVGCFVATGLGSR
jgi:hypothetical protein